jgi:hypothetical protein
MLVEPSRSSGASGVPPLVRYPTSDYGAEVRTSGKHATAAQTVGFGVEPAAEPGSPEPADLRNQPHGLHPAKGVSESAVGANHDVPFFTFRDRT